MRKRLTVYFPAVGIFCLALFVRVLYNMTVGHGYTPEFDAGFYNNLAIHLDTEHCFCLQSHVPDTGRAPFWPFVIAAIYTVMGTYNSYARLFLCILGSGTCVITYLFARDIFNKRIALVVGIIAALYPGLFIYDGWLYTESVYTFFVMGFAYSLFRLQRTPRVGWMISCGISLACASLTRPNGISLLVLVLIWAVFTIRIRMLPWRKVVQAVLVITCLAFGLIAPWTIRNYQISHKFILVATGGGAVLAGSYNDTAVTSDFFGYTGMWVASGKIRPPLTDYSDAGETTYAYHWIRTHPGELPYLFSQHFINMWRPYTSEEGLPVREFPTRLSSQILWNLMTTTPFAIIFLAACGLVVTLRSKWRELLVPYLVIGLTIVLCVAFYGTSRFRAPIEPLLVLLAGGAIWWLTSTESGTLRSLLRKGRGSVIREPDSEAEAVNV
ncbi:ArnT family glycosyltransferase [Ktedonobacter racemifer]|uniref:Glycosyl transferase family 39 n=1 Tax=Ktedonobacter racemifer DSM 44963 TaxID=485913 RepID=D6TBU2_KTERA|nr:glycosyltransferase family 39 protein [Ktedonobacter racemifer]EFH89874.1 glycosyl transferase family 39 [Ktedonobacter racemifer DSM 44963]